MVPLAEVARRLRALCPRLREAGGECVPRLPPRLAERSALEERVMRERRKRNLRERLEDWIDAVY
jgi:hypothetical protein